MPSSDYDDKSAAGVARKAAGQIQGRYSKPLFEDSRYRQRSESTERAQTQRQNERLGTSRPASTLQHLFSPESAAVQDAIHSGNRQKIEATGEE